MKSILGIVVVLILQAHAAAADSGPQLIRKYCEPESSETSACLWTGECPVGGCENKCIVNKDLTSSWSVLLDRGVGLDSFEACPLLSFWLNKMVSIVDTNSRRRLQAQHGDLSGVLRDSRTHSLKRSEWLAQKMAQTVSSNMGDTHLHAQRRRILDFSADAPVPAGEQLPTNPCPTAEEIDSVAFLMNDAAARWRLVFEIDARGEEMPADLVDFAWVLEFPNRYQFLVKMLEDVDATVEYITNNCVEGLVQNLESLFFLVYLEDDQFALLDIPSGGRMLQCRDNFDALDQLTRDLAGVTQACSPPFGQTPDCFTPSGYHMITSTSCAQAYARMFNISDVSNLSNVGRTVEAIQDACTQVATEAECLSASTPVLATIGEYHDKIPVRNALDVPFIGPAGADSPEPVVCFTGQECDPPASPPAAAQDPAEAPGTGGTGPDVPPAPGATTEPPLDRELVTPDDLSASSASRGHMTICLAAAAAVAVFAPALLR